MHNETVGGIAAEEAQIRRRWDEAQCFVAKDDGVKERAYVLEMFPYPSGRVHMGHVRNYTLGDAVARFLRMKGKDVLHPMGWDAFGLPAENAAFVHGAHPAEWTRQNIAAMRAQLDILGLSVDWSREITTCSAEYYRHEQALFLRFFEAGLAEQRDAEVNWDPVEHTVLANEQVVDGRGWRSGAPVERRRLRQWFLKISEFADDLLEGIDELRRGGGWPERILRMQEHWIGRSDGAEIRFASSEGELRAFSTRPETLFGATFLAVAFDHPIAVAAAATDPVLRAMAQAHAAGGVSEAERAAQSSVGRDTGWRVAHPFLAGVEVPVWAASFVVSGHGAGVVFCCPAHDARDHAFARVHKLPIVPVIDPGTDHAFEDRAWTGAGRMVNSDFLNGMGVEAARVAMMDRLEAVGCGGRQRQLRLRDWGISRQRYWGCPIPIVHCPTCGAVAVPDDQLPVEAPLDVSFDRPGNPLATHPTWKHTTCPACGGVAVRETDTFDTFFDSSWYFLRFASPHATACAFDSEAVARWMPVSEYVGGPEHAVMHLLYARFFTRALARLGLSPVKEPFAGVYTQGMVTHATYTARDGAWLYPEEVGNDVGGGAVRLSDGSPVVVGRPVKMSKSKKNTVDPTAIVIRHGADAARLFVLSDSPADMDVEWTETGIEGASRFIRRLRRLAQRPLEADGPDALGLRRRCGAAVAAIGADYARKAFNTAIAKLRVLTTELEKVPAGAIQRACVRDLALAASPIVPHTAECMFQALGLSGLAASADWPEEAAAETVVRPVTIVIDGKPRGAIAIPPGAGEAEAVAAALAAPALAKRLVGRRICGTKWIPGKALSFLTEVQANGFGEV